MTQPNAGAVSSPSFFRGPAPAWAGDQHTRLVHYHRIDEAELDGRRSRICAHCSSECVRAFVHKGSSCASAQLDNEIQLHRQLIASPAAATGVVVRPLRQRRRLVRGTACATARWPVDHIPARVPSRARGGLFAGPPGWWCRSPRMVRTPHHPHRHRACIRNSGSFTGKHRGMLGSRCRGPCAG